MTTLHIFKTGRHVDMAGRPIDFSAADIAATAAAYDPSRHEAPIVVGHPRLDAPAYGWVCRLAADSAGLHAESDQVDPAFAELVTAGRYKKISASFFLPESPSNPVPGTYYLKHVGFLGATAPAVKGLRPVQFADDEAGTVSVEFAAPGAWSIARVLRNLREWLLTDKGSETADQVVPAYAVEELEAAAREPAPEPEPEAVASAPAFADPAPQGDEMSDTEKARLAELEAENARFKAETAARAAEAKRAESAARHTEHVAYAERLVADGLPPAGAQIAVAIMDRLSESDTPLEYGEGDGRISKSPVALLREFLALAAKPVDYAERAAGRAEPTAAFAAPAGYTVDAGRADLHARAKAYQVAHPNTDYVAAVAAVSKGA